VFVTYNKDYLLSYLLTNLPIPKLPPLSSELGPASDMQALHILVIVN